MIIIMRHNLSALFAEARTKLYASGETVFRAGDEVREMFFVADGRAELVRYTIAGAPLVLNQPSKGDIIAEASAYSPTYHCDCVLRADTTLNSISVKRFLDGLQHMPDLSNLWAAKLASELQHARMLSQIRSLKTVRMRLDAWLGLEKSIPPNGEIQELARILGVSREALYRELSRRGR